MWLYHNYKSIIAELRAIGKMFLIHFLTIFAYILPLLVSFLSSFAQIIKVERM